MNKRILSLLLAVLLAAAGLSACSRGNAPSAPDATTTTAPITEIQSDTSLFKLSYTKADSLNPYQSETLNNQVLQSLVFESLFVLDEVFEAHPQLASSYSYEDSTTLIVTIPSGKTFSNGEKIDADTVVYAFERAKDSPHWQHTLASIDSASADSATVIRFHLAWANPMAQNLLTFAVAGRNNDDNGYPVGSGRYRFGEGDGSVYLERNESYPDFNPHIVRIPLVNIASGESVEHAINIGNIAFSFSDLSDGTRSNLLCSKKAVNMNNLVYIGINCKSGLTADENIRRAISLAVDRETIAKSAYRGYAKCAASVFNPSSQLGKDTAVFAATADLTAARQAIASSGAQPADLTVDILTSDNEGKAATATLIKQQLEAVGFTVTINEETAEEYQRKVASGAYNIYIGEVKLTADMSLLPFYSRSGVLSAGLDFDASPSYGSYWGYTNGNNEIGRFVLDYSKEMPFIPLVYRQGMLCYSRALRGDMQGYENNYFANIEDWYFN